MELQERDRQGDRIMYEPILLKVHGVSSFNDNQISFEGLDGFWMWTEWAAKSVDRTDPPPVGTIGWFDLQTNPKRSANAKPGSMYLDIKAFKPASPEEKAAYSPPTRSGGDYANKELATASPQGSQPQTSIDQRINLGMAFNNATSLISAYISGPEQAKNWAHLHESFASVGWDVNALILQWLKWYNEASRGLPLTPVSDEPAVETQRSLSVGPEDRFGDGTSVPDGTEDVEELPW